MSYPLAYSNTYLTLTPKSKKMKRIVLCCLALIGLSFGKSLAQKIDLDRETWAHHYVALPKSKDMASLNTYSITMFANFENINRVGLSPDKIEKTFKLDGFVYTTGAADLVFEVTIEEFKKGPEKS